MNEIRAVLRIAANRLNTSSFLLGLHHAAVVVGVLVLLAVLVQKATPTVQMPWLWVGAGAAVAAVIAAIIMWSTRRPTELQVALAVDDRLDLREKLSTALHVRERDDSFARAAVEDAVSVARDARTREAVRRRFAVTAPNRWWASPLLFAVALLGAWLIPQGDLFGKDADPDVAVIPAEVRSSLSTVIEQVKEKSALNEDLSDLLNQLEANTIDPNALTSPEGAKREAIRKLNELNDRLKEMLEGEKAKTAAAIEESLKQLRAPTDGPGKDLAEALAKSDFRAAAEALEALKQMAESGELTPEQKEQLEKQLNDLAKQLDELAQQQQALEKALENAGIDPNLANDPQAAMQAVQNNQNLNPQQKQQLQQQIQAQQGACQAMQGLGNAMQMAAQGLGNGQFGQNAGQAGQMLNNLEAAQDFLRQAQLMAKQCQGACQGLGRNLALNPGAGLGHGGPGVGAGNVAQRARTPTGVTQEKANLEQSNADIIASLLVEGQVVKGESTAKFRDVVRNAAKSYAEGNTEQVVPLKYQSATKHYFGELEAKVEATEVAPPESSGESAGSSAGGEGADE